MTAKHTPAGVQRFTWDDQDQLIAVEDGRGITRFAYDPLGRRTAKWHEPKTPGRYIGDPHTPGKTRFVWEGLRLRQAITEDAHGTQIRTWLYDPAGGGYTPIAAIDQGLGPDEGVGPALIYSVHTDSLGTPRELTDADGRIAWSARYRAWGQRLGPVLSEADRPTPFATDCPLRYPGQYADDETGLHDNTFRYDDPEIGRFISPDPIGLEGGFNLYQYAPNPVSWIDPLGLYNGEGMRGLGKFHTFHEHILAPNQFTLSDTESGGPGLLDRIFPSLSGFLRFRLPSGLAANESTCYPEFYRQAMNGAAVRCRT